MKYSSDVGWYFPVEEEHMQSWMRNVNKRVNGRLAYQYHKYQACFSYIRETHDIAIDIGSHIGTWSFYLAHDFNKLFAFEPVKIHRQCWHKNIPFTNVLLYATAVGNENRKAVFASNTVPGNSGCTRIDLSETIKGEVVPMIRLDDCPLIEGSIDFVKVDCEGYELFVLQGAEKLLKKYKPCVIVEQKPDTGGYKKYQISSLAAVDYLVSLGAILRKELQGDYILSWSSM